MRLRIKNLLCCEAGVGITYELSQRSTVWYVHEVPRESISTFSHPNSPKQMQRNRGSSLLQFSCGFSFLQGDCNHILQCIQTVNIVYTKINQLWGWKQQQCVQFHVLAKFQVPWYNTYKYFFLVFEGKKIEYVHKEFKISRQKSLKSICKTFFYRWCMNM